MIIFACIELNSTDWQSKAYPVRIRLGLISHHASGDSEGLRAAGVQAQGLKGLREVPCNAQGHIAGALGVQALEMGPPLGMVCLIEGVKGHLEARQAVQRSLVVKDLTGIVQP